MSFEQFIRQFVDHGETAKFEVTALATDGKVLIDVTHTSGVSSAFRVTEDRTKEL